MKFFCLKLSFIIASILCSSMAYASVVVSNDLAWHFYGTLTSDCGATFLLEEENSLYAENTSFGIVARTWLPEDLYGIEKENFKLLEVFSGSDTVGTTKYVAPYDLPDHRGFRDAGFGFYIDSPKGFFATIVVNDRYGLEGPEEDRMHTTYFYSHNYDTYGCRFWGDEHYTLHFENSQHVGADADFDDMVVQVNGAYVTGFNPDDYPTTATPIPCVAFLFLSGLSFVFKKRG